MKDYDIGFDDGEHYFISLAPTDFLAEWLEGDGSGFIRWDADRADIIERIRIELLIREKGWR